MYKFDSDILHFVAKVFVYVYEMNASKHFNFIIINNTMNNTQLVRHLKLNVYSLLHRKIRWQTILQFIFLFFHLFYFGVFYFVFLWKIVLIFCLPTLFMRDWVYNSVRINLHRLKVKTVYTPNKTNLSIVDVLVCVCQYFIHSLLYMIEKPSIRISWCFFCLANKFVCLSAAFYNNKSLWTQIS